MTPTLVASRTALPPEGAGLTWGGPALRPLEDQAHHESLRVLRYPPRGLALLGAARRCGRSKTRPTMKAEP